MKKIKAIAILVTFVGVVAALAVGAGVISHKKRQKKIDQRVILARESLDDGDYETALDLAGEVIETYGARNNLDLLHHIQARANYELGRVDEAVEQWTLIRETYPDSEFTLDTLLSLAQVEMDKDSAKGIDAAYEIYRQIERDHPGTPEHYQALSGFATIDIADGQLLSAQKTLERIVTEAPHFPGLDEAMAKLGDLNVRILRSNVTRDGDVIYEVKSGDALARIGKRFNVNYELIMAVNGIDDPRRLRPGQKLKIPDLEFSLEVDIGNNTMTLLNKGKFFKRYLVRTGETEGSTPLGEYRISLKEKNPTWYHDGRVYPGNHPENELGTRWMPFSGSDLGIHGTIHPDTIGKYSSNGCVGMYMEDVEELYDLVRVNTPLKITGVRKQPRKRGDG